MTAARLADVFGARLADKVASTHRDVQRLARRDHAAVKRLRAALRDDPICLIDREADVHDIPGLVDLQMELFA